MDPVSNRHTLLSELTNQIYKMQHACVILFLDLLLAPLFQLLSSVAQDARSFLQSLALGSKSDTETASFGLKESAQEHTCGCYP